MLRHVYFETVYLIVSRDDINSREEGRKFRFIKGNTETKKNTMYPLWSNWNARDMNIVIKLQQRSVYQLYVWPISTSMIE